MEFSSKNKIKSLENKVMVLEAMIAFIIACHSDDKAGENFDKHSDKLISYMQDSDKSYPLPVVGSTFREVGEMVDYLKGE